MRLARAALALVTLAPALLAGCTTTTGATVPTPPSGSACQTASCAHFVGAPAVQVFVEPEARTLPVAHGIEGANRSVWLEVYLLTDTTIVHALEDAAARGVDVRVMLDTSPFGGGGTAAQQTLETLGAAGVHVEAADPAFHYTHEKAMVVDGATAYIMTCNLTLSGLGGSSLAKNREYGIIDTDAGDVGEVAGIFLADWSRGTPVLVSPHLFVSPVNARARLLALLASARSTLWIEDEEMVDPQSEDALIAAVQRGVHVEVILPAPSSSTPPSTDVARLVHGGVQVRYAVVLYMHAKLIVSDNTLAFVGSENFSANSLDDNRELGIAIGDPTAIATLASTFALDWSAAEANPT